MANYDQIRIMLPVNKHRLDDELEVQPVIMEMITRELIKATSRAVVAKEELAKLESREAEEIREDEPKLSISAVDGKVRRLPSRISAFESYQVARIQQESWQGLLEAWKQKGYSLKTLADLYSAQYFSTDSLRGEARKKQDEEQAEQRAALRRANHTPVFPAKPEPAATGRRSIKQ